MTPPNPPTNTTQSFSVDGQDQGSLVGLRAPNQNNPVQDVSSADITCGKVALTDATVITVPAGAEFGAYWGHVIGGEQFPGDPDNPIAASHHGPITAWLAAVDDAASASLSGLEWYKIGEDNLDVATSTWGVDNMIANDGWSYFTMPSCITPGQYLLRVEIIALHSAYDVGQAQFYTSCAQIEVTGSGSFTPTETAQFPGAYSATDPSIQINIYGTGGVANNNGQAYEAPGMRPITC